MARILFVCFLLCSTSLIAQASASAPSSQPVLERIPALLAELDSADPEIRVRASEQLMLLDPDLLPELRRKLEDLETISVAQSVALQEIVIHIYMTAQHNFRGDGAPIIGVMISGDETTPCIVGTRLIGFDAYRALRDHDQIAAISLVNPADDSLTAQNEIKLFKDMKGWMKKYARPGAWIEATVIRGNERINVRIRVASDPDVDSTDISKSRIYKSWQKMAFAYWEREFEPLVRERSRR